MWLWCRVIQIVGYHNSKNRIEVRNGARLYRPLIYDKGGTHCRTVEKDCKMETEQLGIYPEKNMKLDLKLMLRT